MAYDKIIENIGKLWSEWNIRGFIILSLSLQVFLIVFSPFRKCTSNIIISSLIWMAYLSADWVATFVVGHVATTQGESSAEDGEHLAFWAAFLLVHLGGPGTITALNLEDNALWVRHLLSLILQVGTVCYIFLRVQMMSTGKLLLPTILVSISGLIKYSERTAALYLASTGKLKDSMLKDSLKLRNEESSKPYDFGEGDLLDECVIVKHAYHLYEVSKGLLVDLIISFDEQHKIREFFQKLSPEEALKVISAELNFFYDALYTKAIVSNTSLGLLFRCLSLGTVVAALLWFLLLSKDSYSKFDVKLSYALLFGAVALDGIGLLMILFSDWPVPKIASFGKASTAGSRIKNYFIVQKSPNWVKHELTFNQRRHSLAETSVIFRRWSESIPQYSLINHAAGMKSDEIYSFDSSLPCLCYLFILCGTIIYLLVAIILLVAYSLLKLLAGIARAILGMNLTESIEKWRLSVTDKLGLTEEEEPQSYVSKLPLPKELWSFIFNELKNKSIRAQNNPQLADEQIIKAKRDFSLRVDEFEEDCVGILRSNIGGLDFDEIVLLWHIVTIVLYHGHPFDEDDPMVKDDRIFGRILADYMLYLLAMNPAMMSTVAGAGQIRYRDARTDTLASARGLFKKSRRNVGMHLPVGHSQDDAPAPATIFDALERICGSSPAEKNSRSVWADACSLGKKIMNLDCGEKRWRLIAKVWVEILSYAASHCKGEAHAQALSTGGELITFVWLLMFHLGLSQ